MHLLSNLGKKIQLKRCETFRNHVLDLPSQVRKESGVIYKIKATFKGVYRLVNPTSVMVDLLKLVPRVELLTIKQITS